MKRLTLPILICSLFLSSALQASSWLEIGFCPQFGMQRNNEVILTNDFTGIGFAARLSREIFRDASVGPSIYFEASYLNFGNEFWTVPLASSQTGVNCDVSSNYSITGLCPGLSFGTRFFSVRPYGQVFGGPAYFMIKNNFNNTRWIGSKFDQDSDYSHWSYLVGAGGGVKFVLWENEKDGNTSTLKDVVVDLQVNYQRSGISSFVVKQNLSRPDLSGPVLFETTPSKVNVLEFRFGLSMRLQ